MNVFCVVFLMNGLYPLLGSLLAGNGRFVVGRVSCLAVILYQVLPF